MSEGPLDTCLPRFARHGSYPPKWGWLPKVHAAVGQDPQAFSRPAAPVLFAVGSSMVPAMRFWALAFGLIEPVDGGRAPPAMRPPSAAGGCWTRTTAPTRGLRSRGHSGCCTGGC